MSWSTEGRFPDITMTDVFGRLTNRDARAAEAPLRTLPQALADGAHSGAGYTFVRQGIETHRTFAEMLDASLRVARVLRRAGLDRGDVVALVIDDAEQFLTTLFGASIAGVVIASLTPPAPASDRRAYAES